MSSLLTCLRSLVLIGQLDPEEFHSECQTTETTAHKMLLVGEIITCRLSNALLLQLVNWYNLITSVLHLRFYVEFLLEF